MEHDGDDNTKCSWCRKAKKRQMEQEIRRKIETIETIAQLKFAGIF